MEIGERIRRRRESLNMTQDELAERVGYSSRSSIAKIESGANQLTQKSIAAFADALDMYPSELLGLSQEGIINATNYESDLMKIPGFRQLNEIIKKNRVNDDFVIQLLQYAMLLDEHYEAKKHDTSLIDRIEKLQPQDKETVMRMIEALTRG